jgi:hypothetical protein
MTPAKRFHSHSATHGRKSHSTKPRGRTPRKNSIATYPYLVLLVPDPLRPFMHHPRESVEGKLRVSLVQMHIGHPTLARLD